jgi:hypothetical protein
MNCIGLIALTLAHPPVLLGLMEAMPELPAAPFGTVDAVVTVRAPLYSGDFKGNDNDK